MKKIIIFFLALLVSVWLGLKLQSISGYILISYKDINIQTTLWFSVITIILAFAIFYIIVRLFTIIFTLPKKIRKISKKHRERSHFLKSIKEINHLIDGKWSLAEKKLVRIAKKSTASLATLDYLAAALASQKLGTFDKRDNYLNLAKIKDPNSSLIVEIAKAQLLIANGEWEKALLNLKKIYKLNPKHKLIIKLLMQVYLHFQNWKHLFYLLPCLQTNKVISKKDYIDLKQEIYLGLLKYYIDLKAKTKVENLWQQLPRRTKRDPKLMLPYLEYLYQSEDRNSKELAEKMVQRALQKTFDENLIEFYCSIKSKHAIKQLKIVEKWLTQYSENVILLSSLGKLCQHLMLWGKARHYLEKALIIEPSCKIYHQLAITMEKQGDKNAAYDYYRKAAQQSIS